jgi:hypothetical protein
MLVSVFSSESLVRGGSPTTPVAYAGTDHPQPVIPHTAHTPAHAVVTTSSHFVYDESPQIRIHPAGIYCPCPTAAAPEPRMDSSQTAQLVEALSSLAARLDAVTWVTGALLESHPDPAAVLEAWNRRVPDASDSGFEIPDAAAAYRQKFQQELSEWSETLAAIARQRTHASR